ncbi:MAG TPA: hypothetical protein GX006_07065 [Clostridiales bacterium]|nr:hypothetical protein [Clostridiales bacterium]
MRDQVLILNFDGSYSAALASKLRAEKISAKILPGNTSAEQIMGEEALGVILSGGTKGEVPVDLDGQLLRSGIPVLALGSTVPAVTTLLGGQVDEALPIDDVDTLTFLPSRITEDLHESERMFGTVHTLGLTDDLEPLALYEDKPIGLAHKTLEIYAIGCQLEPNDPDMMSLLTQFAINVCGCTRWWSEDSFISITRAQIQEKAGDGRALCVMSGGLDSGVTALLAHRALGDQLTCVFVDTGLLRENEVVEFSAYYKSAGLNLEIINAEDRVMEALAGLTKQSDKANALRKTLQAVLKETGERLEYSLLIESKSSDYLFSNSAPSKAASVLAEGVDTIAPLADLFKEEIRRVGEALGLPQHMTAMQPFPFTGLALRIIGECTKERLNLLRWADAAFRQEIEDAGLAKRLWKYFAMLHEVPYQETEEDSLVVLLRAVSVSHTGSDLRALPARLPYDLLERYTQRALKHSPLVKKVIWDLTPAHSLQEAEWP